MATYQVETGDVAISSALLAIAEDHGWKIWGGISNRYCPWLVLTSDGEGGLRVDWNKRPVGRHDTVSIPDFVALLRKGPPPPSKEEQIRIGGDIVLFQSGGIAVGCVSVPTATVDAIHARLHRATP